MQKLNVPVQMENLTTVLDFAENVLHEAGVPQKTVLQTAIVIDELFSNIVRYSGATELTFAVGTERGCIEIRFTDNGKPYDPTLQPEPAIDLSAEERPIGGLGIYLVRKLMDMVRYEYSGGVNVLSLVKNYEAPASS